MRTSRTANAAVRRYRGDLEGEVGAGLAVVGLSADRALKEAATRDDLIRVAHRAGVSLRRPAEVSGLGRGMGAAIVNTDPMGA